MVVVGSMFDFAKLIMTDQQDTGNLVLLVIIYSSCNALKNIFIGSLYYIVPSKEIF